MTVVLGSRDIAKGVAAARELISAGGKVAARQLDVASVQSVRECMAWVRRDLGRLDVLVNNAGIMVDESEADPIEELEIVRDTIQTNVYGPLLLSRLSIPIMKSRRYGRIVNLSSGMGSLNEMSAGYIGYRMSKAGVNVVTRVLAAESQGMGILVNSVDPGWVRTDMGGEAPANIAKGGVRRMARYTARQRSTGGSAIGNRFLVNCTGQFHGIGFRSINGQSQRAALSQPGRHSPPIGFFERVPIVAVA
jgi:NAD(P)-dependent dehydrogenase (short-subunit alcohol dehydrogenase family)